MEDKDKALFYRTMKSFFYSLNGTATPDQGSLSHYWNALKGYSTDKVIKALTELAQTETSHVMPGKVVEKVTGKKAVKAKDEFELMVNLVKKHGVTGARERIDQTSKGWVVLKSIGGLSAINTTDLNAARAAFYQAYDSEKAA